ncbi:hypothetical protein KI809_09340 [Geobacter pelophilus]|uniref:RelA/SpoT domain-containing protein n=1 Tax=Geoanaerobacter pelophilus TaxID=60036 RepID=A0AAW4L2S0_9BACT|nr:hypothetical protein [Geoanaerobacter pelophilus]MBT0664502.1 hypothetical protein [Geoanaerobacter pelophilus]
MPDIIDNSVSILEQVISYYKTGAIKNELDTIANNIKTDLASILDDNASKFDLIISNSVATKKLYSIVYRIKDPVSLSEKFIRKSDGLKFIVDSALASCDDVMHKPEVIKRQVKLLGDIIGIKIITELKTDCHKVYDLIMNNLSNLEKKHIKFIDIKDQPLSMKNGLSIYNIKAAYQNECNFELQIKSKIDSAWGDLDHTIFYKDYKVSPIKSTVQVSMNRIGMLLSELEHFLHDIRESDKEYNERSNFITECDLLQKRLSPLICEKLKVDYDITDISPQLIHFCKAIGVTIDNTIPEINFKSLEIRSDDDDVKHYVNIRNRDYKLMILESAFMSWFSQKNNDEVSIVNYRPAFTEYIKQLNKYLVEQIIQNNPNFDIGKVNDYIVICTTEYIKYIPSAKIYLSTTCHVDLIKQINYINDYWDEDRNVDDRNLILSAYIIQAFDGDYKMFIEDVNDGQFESSVPMMIKECIKNMKENDAIDKKLVIKLEHGIDNILIHMNRGE